MRKEMVNQERGQTYMTVKQHFDDMVSELSLSLAIFWSFEADNCSDPSLQKRATVRTLDYFWHPLSETPFSLGIALPQDYGRYRVNGKIEVALAKANCEYRVGLVVWQPGWVDLDLECSTIMLGQ